MQERRKLKRRNMSYYVPVIDPKSNEIIGHLVDISPQGLMMDSQTMFPVERDCRLRINVTADVANKNSIEFIARSKWCRQDSIEAYLYDIGFEIIKIEDKDLEELRKLVMSLTVCASET